ncbi:hypothetical protein V8E54_014551 [Elaphomyces granulatus]
MFLLRVFVLLVILLSAAAEYDIRDCDPEETTWVDDALHETKLIAGLAAKTFRAALDAQTGIPPQVQRILEAFLPNSNEGDYEVMWKTYTTIGNRLDISDIQYYCKDPTLRNSNGNSLYPIDMTRVDGQRQGYDECENNYLGGNYYMHVSEPNPADLAYTVTSTPGSPAFKKQQTCTGSNKEWSDIVMPGILREVKEGRGPATFSDLPRFLGVQDWSEVTSPLTANPVMTVILLHAIIHSVGVLDPNPGHSQTASGENANSLSQVMSGYFIPSALPPKGNPSTLAWVAFILVMVGYYLDKAILRPNIVEGKVWFPEWALDGDPITSELYYEVMRKGPFQRVWEDDCNIDCPVP